MSPKIIIVLSAILLVAFASASAQELKFAKEIGTIKLNVPDQKDARKYLGLKQESGQFNLAQLRQGILIVEIFNMYCPHCQHYAPTVNQFYSLLNSRADTKNRVMLIGIGVGNSPFEVNVYKKKYNIAFPLFDDKGYSIANKLDGVLTPHFIAINLDGRGGYRVFYSQNGGFDKPEEFLNNILKLSGGNK
jgi:thiol-disulfide isomerase/thioredoxin